MKQYIVFLAGMPSGRALSKVLARLPGVTIIQQLDSSTALVEMTNHGQELLKRELPEASVEPNIVYRLQA